MKIGDLVKKVKSPGNMTGVIVGWHEDIGYRSVSYTHLRAHET